MTEAQRVKTIEEVLPQLNNQSLSSEALINDCFERINAQGSQASVVFTRLYEDQAKAQAKAYDSLRRANVTVPPYAGVPITIKDLFDIEGSVTTAGSVVLKDHQPATKDAEAVNRLRQAGFIIVGRTNMTEFAYSGLGLNPHYGTPLNPFDREQGRIPGGSSSGAMIAVTDGFACASLGTDTGGSCRIPAALCGGVGFKPTAKRVPADGCLPLSHSLDSIGPLANSVESCIAMDSILSGQTHSNTQAIPVSGLRVGVPQQFVLEGMDEQVAQAFENALSVLSEAGAQISEVSIPELEEIPHMNRLGGFTAAEAFAWHKTLLEQSESEYDPRVSTRIRRGEGQTAADYLELLSARQSLIERVDSKTKPYDVLLMPTVPAIAPTVKSLDDEDTYHTTNLLMLRNPTVTNLLDRCAISLPCHAPEQAPVGLMLMGEHGEDSRLLTIARSIEALIKRS